MEINLSVDVDVKIGEEDAWVAEAVFDSALKNLADSVGLDDIF